MIGRFPILDISPVTYFGGELIGAKAIPNERISISATIIREGHDSFSVAGMNSFPEVKVPKRMPMAQSCQELLRAQQSEFQPLRRWVLMSFTFPRFIQLVSPIEKAEITHLKLARATREFLGELEILRADMTL
ncbi:MAG: DUF3416 domain-containing protein [Actinobacteria bacterium]|nr:DUF3416 domain-containing protein [Actinomycetota bacterium]